MKNLGITNNGITDSVNKLSLKPIKFIEPLVKFPVIWKATDLIETKMIEDMIRKVYFNT